MCIVLLQVFAQSRLKASLLEGEWPPSEARFRREVGEVEVAPYIAADAAYPLLHCVITPYKGTLTYSQDVYNYCHSSNRMRAEHVMGRVKGRFRTLNGRQAIQSERHVNLIIAACFIIHNICIDNGDSGKDYESEIVQASGNEADDDVEVVSEIRTYMSSHAAGTNIREALREYCVELAATGGFTMSERSTTRRLANNEATV